jgi:organic hydroperoxide reductase OsmC/OhrA
MGTSDDKTIREPRGGGVTFARMRAPRAHTYEIAVRWTGNRGTGTSDFRSYDRAHEVSAAGPPVIDGSSDPAFRGDKTRWNPEQLLVVSLSQCHMLWYLHLAAEAGVTVVAYHDDAVGTMVEEPSGAGRFTQVVLRPHVVVGDPTMVATAESLHGRIEDFCFIARSVNFPVRHEPVTAVADETVEAVEP